MKARAFMIGHRRVAVWVAEVEDESTGEHLVLVDNKNLYDEHEEDRLRDEREAEQQRILERL